MKMNRQLIKALALELLSQGELLWAAELSRITNRSPQTCSKILKHLRKVYHLKKRKIGPCKVYFL